MINWIILFFRFSFQKWIELFVDVDFDKRDDGRGVTKCGKFDETIKRIYKLTCKLLQIQLVNFKLQVRLFFSKMGLPSLFFIYI